MDIIEKTNTGKIKRRNFFYYIGAAVVSAFVLTKFPLNIFKKTAASRNSSVKVKENPLAVKRKVKDSANG